MDIIYEEWCCVAEHCEEEYGIQFDREEDFFTCIECQEPIYFSDFGDEVDPWICPICGFNFLTGENTELDQYGEVFITSYKSVGTVRG